MSDLKKISREAAYDALQEGRRNKSMNALVTTEFDLAVVASRYDMDYRERRIAKWFYNRGKYGRSKN